MHKYNKYHNNRVKKSSIKRSYFPVRPTNNDVELEKAIANHAPFFDGIYFDNCQQKIISNRLTKWVKKYNDVISYTPIYKSHYEQRKHSIMRVIAGDLLLGFAGVAMGVLANGKAIEIIDELSIIIGFNDNTQLTLDLITKPTPKQNAINELNIFNSLCTLSQGLVHRNMHKESLKNEKLDLANIKKIQQLENKPQVTNNK